MKVEFSNVLLNDLREVCYAKRQNIDTLIRVFEHRDIAYVTYPELVNSYHGLDLQHVVLLQLMRFLSQLYYDMHLLKKSIDYLNIFIAAMEILHNDIVANIKHEIQRLFYGKAFDEFGICTLHGYQRKISLRSKIRDGVSLLHFEIPVLSSTKNAASSAERCEEDMLHFQNFIELGALNAGNIADILIKIRNLLDNLCTDYKKNNINKSALSGKHYASCPFDVAVFEYSVLLSACCAKDDKVVGEARKNSNRYDLKHSVGDKYSYILQTMLPAFSKNRTGYSASDKVSALNTMLNVEYMIVMRGVAVSQGLPGMHSISDNRVVLRSDI